LRNDNDFTANLLRGASLKCRWNMASRLSPVCLRAIVPARPAARMRRHENDRISCETQQSWASRGLAVGDMPGSKVKHITVSDRREHVLKHDCSIDRRTPEEQQFDLN